MPLYSFINDETEEVIDVFMSMNDKHEYFDASGYQWRRIFYSPMASIDTKIDPMNKNEFIRKGEKYTTVGSLQDKSQELSDIRSQKNGYDPIKQDFFKKYSEERNGKKHVLDRPKKFENDRVSIDFTAKP